ncbi:cell envelope integrity protein CreD [Dysgonomonas sp. 520]|uniref:cell envelope integrity protein CreD n=1 Tax=Dysgonomonas sp. 520 TaxID=2302931 RepID=UPI0013D5A95C|nr:cell envelope integrity protein CreD [Dysgonomonas sp. 520]NDW10639.1 cell envelope integrity protein CreD [Dysgonomonas sp. 520]
MNQETLSKANTITVKAILVAVLTLLMLIPVGMIKSLIEERTQNKVQVQDDISSKWGGKQSITGPILVLPYKHVSGEGTEKTLFAYFLPDEYNIDGKMDTEERSRGVYDILCYQAQAKISGKFLTPDVRKLGLNPDHMKWDEAYVLIGIPHLQGIKNQISFNWNGKPQGELSSAVNKEILPSGLTIKVPINPESLMSYNFDFDLTLNGTQGIEFTPIGKQTHIHISSLWKTATFSGDFLPNKRVVDDNGFDAQWDIFDYNRDYPQMWITGGYSDLQKSNLGVDLLLPIDEYQQTMRSAKYAVMFIALTFLVFFLVEILGKRKIHPIQYVLVSLALVLFYTLLLSFSEHMQFALSYLISAAATVILITAYSKTIFKDLKQTLLMGGFLAGLYTYLYVVLQLEDTALLIGSVGLFVALAIVMFILRKVNWYKKEDKQDNEKTEKPTDNEKPYYNVNNQE